MKTLKEIRDALYGVNATNVSLYMIGLKKRDDKVVYDTNGCLAEILAWLDECIDAEAKTAPKSAGPVSDPGRDDRLDRINGQIVSILEGYDAPEDRGDVAAFLCGKTGLSIETVARMLRAIARR